MLGPIEFVLMGFGYHRQLPPAPLPNQGSNPHSSKASISR
uniref:Uncharacterized protein n=1 Tax=Nelumbo nucifera TaxID=4432 RepID=A0A822XW23_NELNU|nr:TPA_asm: hypothetical protein HUJ06_027302 [Nelumbo nucifera]